ncbi:MAG: ATP-dependent helicase [Acidimicrobiales bacterium]
MTSTDGAGAGGLAAALGGLTEPQRQAVDSPAAAICVQAGAGSGKTRVLTLRVARRIRDGSAEADHSVVVTFTRKAAQQLRQRLAGFGVGVAIPSTSGAAPGPGVRAGTLHQLALTLLRRHALDAGNPPPNVADHRFRLVSDIVGDPMRVPVVAAEIGWAKSRCLTPETYGPSATDAGRSPSIPVDQVADHFRAYQGALARRHAIDLDDLVVAAADLIFDDAAFAAGVHWRYRHLSVDEFQDINPAQYRLIEALMGDRGDLLAVGDPNQAIYGWNGADPGLITRLPTLVPDMEVLRLDENHRSTPQVVAAASAALGRAVHGVPRASGPAGPMPVVTAFEDETAEAEGVASRLLAELEGGRAWSELAVLARTNDQLSVISAALTRSGIPFRMAPAPEAPPATRPGADGAAEADAVELATFHRAKGLEWPSVCVVGIEDGFIPIIHAATDAAREEERRLLYVALTRASVQLHCSWARSRRTNGGRRVDREPSPWLAAVARVSRAGTGRITPVDAGRRIAELRAGLGG